MIQLKVIDQRRVSVRGYDRIMEKELFPARPEPDEVSARPLWAFWMLFLPSFSPEFAIGFEERASGGSVWFRSARVQLWSFWQGLQPRDAMMALAAGLLPPRVWVWEQLLNPVEWSPVYTALAGTETRWRHRPAHRLDGCSVSAWYWTEQAVCTLRERGPEPSVWSDDTGALISDALSLADHHIKDDDEAHQILREVLGCFP
jgi:hypothetical protein